MWIDFRAYGLYGKELENLVQQKASLFLDEGYIFGKAGDGFERLSLACPRKYLEYAMERLNKALQEL